MTEKRYVPYQNGLRLWIIEDKFKNDVVRIPSFLGFDNEETAKSICDEWNTLYDENEQLKSENNELKLMIRQDEFAKEEGFK